MHPNPFFQQAYAITPLVEAGNGVTLTNYEGMMHGLLDAARRAVAQSAALGEAFAAV